ncbi:MAG: CPBP family intramembrane metalloprotease [Bacteroidales bacterium]|nr:CPBP family intramembrane metalloprotease [Bacteroidales bacterium]
MKKIRYYLPTLGGCWGLLGMVVLGQLLASIVALPLKSYTDIYSFVVYVLTFLLPFLVVRSNAKAAETQQLVVGGVPEMPINNPDFKRFSPYLLFPLAALATIALQIVVEPVVNLLPTSEWFEKIMEALVAGGNVWWTLLTVAVCAPLLEELFCRGFMLRGLIGRGYSPRAAILWSALIFAVMHLNPWQAIPAFCLGVFFGWLYWRTGCLWLTIFLHAVNNGFSVIASRVFGEDVSATDSVRDLFADAQTYWLVYAIAVGVCALTYFLVSKYIPKHNGQDETVIPA